MEKKKTIQLLPLLNLENYLLTQNLLLKSPMKFLEKWIPMEAEILIKMKL